MKWHLLSTVFLASLSVAGAQPFDTLLSQFRYINELYPLADSTYFLVGYGDEFLVERVDAKANTIWSTALGSYRDYSMTNYKVTLTDLDTTIQVLLSERSCDVYGSDEHRSFTLNNKGVIIDQQHLSNVPYGSVALLSGHADDPRLVYNEDEVVVLVQANNDTSHLTLNWGSSDTTNSYLIGEPYRYAMCPGGDLLIGASIWVFTLQKQSDRYTVVDFSWSNNGRTLYCLEEGSFIELGSGSLSLWHGHDFSAYYIWPEGFIVPSNVRWRPPYLSVRVHGAFIPDSIFIFDKELSLIRNMEVPMEHALNTVVLTDNTDFYAGQGNTYYDHSLLLSIDRQSNEGPLTYDVSLLDYQLAPYDTFYPLNGGFIHYLIPDMTVTLRNNCNYTINDAVITYAGWNGLCGDTIWSREINNMQVSPGETRSFEIQDVFIRKFFPESEYDKTCIALTRPDNHLDDQYDDNKVCKKIEFPTATAFPTHNKIRVNPTLVADKISFQSDSPLQFDFRVYNFNGSVVLSGKASTYTDSNTDVSALPPGMYIIQYAVPGNSQVPPGKVIKY